MKTSRLCALAAAVALAGAAEARAQAGLLVPTSTGRPDATVLSLREMAIDVGIARGYARVNVRQVYENHTGGIQEGTYRFALPPSGAVGDFAVWDGLVRIPGVILEKQRARAIYRELTMQRIDPGLLQQGEEEGGGADAPEPSGRPSGGALFSVTVAPIPAYGTKRLELQFQQEVPVIRREGEFRLALAPPDGEPPVAARFTVRVLLEGGEPAPAEGDDEALPLTRKGAELVFDGVNTPLNKDLVVRFVTPLDAPPLRVDAFRNPSGSLPDGVALAPWERPSELPPEKDGFFLVEALPPGDTPAVTASKPGAAPAPSPARPPLSVVVLFDTSLSHRWSGLEAGYASLTHLLSRLGGKDHFALIAFDRRPDAEAALRAATADAVEAALTRLRARPLGAGTEVAAALNTARALVGDRGRLVLITDGMGNVTSKALLAARGDVPLFTILTGTEAGEAFRSGSTQVLASTATDIETQLFYERLVAPPAGPEAAPAPKKVVDAPVPFEVKGGEPKLHDVYPVMVQPLEPGSLSGWVGRYGAPQPALQFELPSPLFAGGRATAAAALPETALDARDLPRRWARARVDHLLALIEAEGEKKEWIDEIIDLSKRYKFVTPYTAFLAAPRSLLRPRRIQPGDPVLRVECDANTRSVVALFPFGLRLPLVKRPGTRLWEGRFLVPEGIADGRYAVRIVLRDGSGARVTETKHFVLDGTAPRIQPDRLAAAAPGERVRVSVRADDDVVVLSARLGEGPPVPLRWDAAAHRSVGELRVPPSAVGPQEVVFEAVDGAKNVGFARTRLEVRP